MHAYPFLQSKLLKIKAQPYRYQYLLGMVDYKLLSSFLSYRMNRNMEPNPWQVNDIEEFSHFNCPECPFKSQVRATFENHALEKHPLSIILFDKMNEGITYTNKSVSSDFKPEVIVDKIHQLLDKLKEKLKSDDFSDYDQR